jgi:lipopolysaccharide transport system permease protein
MAPMMEQLEDAQATSNVDVLADEDSRVASRIESPENGDSVPFLVIEPTAGWRSINFRELWRFRELLFFLTWRDVQVRYKQTVLGAAWAVIQPLMTMVVFNIFFGKLGGMDQKIDGPYPVFAYAGLLPWIFFSGSVSHSGQSLIQSERLISKVYFPRLLIPFAAVGAQIVDFGISFLVMLGIMAWYHVIPTWSMLLLPVLVAGTTLAALGAGTLLASLSIAYRDFRYVIPFLVQIWMFVSPVPYSSKEIPEKWRLVYAINPMAGLIEGFRAALLGETIAWDTLGVSLVAAAIIFLIGLSYFRRTERRFADIV